MFWVQEATYSHWLSLVGGREALDTGDVIDFDAPPRARREHDRDAAQRQLMSDMHAALRAHSHLIPCALFSFFFLLTISVTRELCFVCFPDVLFSSI